MQLSPSRQAGEAVSSFRFRYAWFSLKWAVFFGILLLVLVFIRPDVNHSPMPLLLMALYFGLPIGLGISVLSTIGFVIGGFFAQNLERSPSARWLWSRVKFAFLVLTVVPLTVFSGYWLFLGITTLETQAFTRGGIRLITPQSAPLFFWLSLIGWALCTFGFPYFLYRNAKLLFRRP